MKFLVSVVVTLYNYKDYIKDCIKSFLDQDFMDSEIIIVDDASIDNPYEGIRKYIGERVKYIKLSENKGYSNAKNVGIRNCLSDVIVMLDADDMLTKKGISVRYNKIIKGYDLVHGPALDFKNGHTTPSRMWAEWKKTKQWKYVHAQGIMLKKQIHKKIGLYDSNLRCKSDREMLARIFNHGFKIGTVNKFVCLYRKHSRQMHRSKEKIKNNVKLQKYVMNLIEKRKMDLSELEFLD